MRLRENYGWHFPELSKIVSNNDQYAKVVLAIGDKSRLTEDDLHDLAAVVDDDEGVAQAIVKAARTSMGRDLSEADMEIVMAFAKRTASLAAYRRQLSNYLGSRMNQVAPNLAALIGDTVGARLISKADQPFQVPCLDCADPWCRESAFPSVSAHIINNASLRNTDIPTD
jgi:nucleolar protein 56